MPFYKYYDKLAGFAAYRTHNSFGFGAAVLQGKDREIPEKKVTEPEKEPCTSGSTKRCRSQR